MEELKIVNLKQVSRYLKYGLHPKRIENGRNDKLVFIYNKDEDTNKAYTKWLNYDES